MRLKVLKSVPGIVNCMRNAPFFIFPYEWRVKREIAVGKKEELIFNQSDLALLPIWLGTCKAHVPEVLVCLSEFFHVSSYTSNSAEDLGSCAYVTGCTDSRFIIGGFVVSPQRFKEFFI